MGREIFVPRKNDMEALILLIKDAEENPEDIPVHTNQGKT